MARGRKPKTSTLKRGNGMGSVRKLSGSRRKPYGAYITTGFQFDPDTLVRKQIQKSIGYFKTREEAEHALDAYIINPTDIELANLTFEEVYKQWYERYCKTLTSNSSIRSIDAAYKYSAPLHNKLFTGITITNMRDTIENAKCGPATKSRMKSVYNLIYDYAVESEIVRENRARQFSLRGIEKSIKRAKKDKHCISEKHEQLLWDNIEFGYIKMILIEIYTGFRPNELCTLKKENVNLEENYIIGGEKTDAGTDRYVPIHPKIKDLVSYYYDMKISNDNLFVAIDGQVGKNMTYDKYRGRFKKAMAYCNIPDDLYTPHSTRHTFITKAKIAGMNDVAIKKIAGHEIRDITEAVYTHRDEYPWLQEEIKKIP